MPAAISVAALGLFVRLIESPLGPAEEKAAMLRLFAFLGLAAILIAVG